MKIILPKTEFWSYSMDCVSEAHQSDKWGLLSNFIEHSEEETGTLYLRMDAVQVHFVGNQAKAEIVFR